MEPTFLYIALLPMLVACLVVMTVHPTLVKIARLKQLVDKPNERKLNKTPVPMLGGVGVLFGLMVGVGLSGCFVPEVRLPVEVLVGMIVLMYVGVADDILDLRPRLKLLLQSFAVLSAALAVGLYVDNLHGVWGLYHLPEWPAMALTLVAGVGIINAVNMIDGVDGLCALYAAYVSLIFGMGFLMAEDLRYALLAFATLGALLPFMLHNIYGTKYKMFLGDGGSLVIGFICVVYVMRQLQTAECAFRGSSIAFAFAVMAVPVCDTLRVMVQRMVRRRSPFMPDKSHLHHLFIALGMNHPMTAFAMVGLDVVIVGVWLASVAAGESAERQIMITIVSAVLVTWGLHGIMQRAIGRKARFVTRLRWVAHGRQMRRRAFTERLRRVLDDKT